MNQTDTFTYRAGDGQTTSDVATVSILVGNQAPQADNDSYSTVIETPLIVGTDNGGLANDIDADGDSMTVILGTDVSNGVLQLNDDGSFSYTPDDLYTGTDGFTYTVTDGNLTSSEGSVVISVVDGLKLEQAVYANETQAVYKEYWVSHDWFTGGDECANPNNPPTGGVYYIEL